MNERTINDLAVKSGLAEDMGRGYKFPDNYLDFAELIVRECAEIAKKVDGDESDDYQSGRTWAGIDVLKHFGVEE